MGWGPWRPTEPELITGGPLAYAEMGADSGFVFGTPLTGVPPDPDETVLDGHYASVLATGGADGTFTDATLGVAWDWFIAQDSSFVTPATEYVVAINRNLLSFSAIIPDLVTYPTPSDGAYPGDPEGTGYTQYAAGTEAFQWSDGNIDWIANVSFGPTPLLRGRFVDYIDPTTGLIWPAYDAAGTFGELSADGNMAVPMSTSGYQSSDTFSIWFEQSQLWSPLTIADLVLADPGIIRATGDWGPGGVVELPQPFILRPPHRQWEDEETPNLTGLNGPTRRAFHAWPP